MSSHEYVLRSEMIGPMTSFIDSSELTYHKS